MLLRHTALAIFALVFLAAGASLPAQQVVGQGPPPEIRALVDAVITAVNSGSPDAWESFAQARFAPSLLQKQTREQRAEQYQQIATRFGTVAIQGVRRQGPDAPLELMVKGSASTGVIEVGVEGDATPKITSLTATG